MHYLAQDGDVEVVNLLMVKFRGVDAIARDKDGPTPLHTATANGHAEMVELLVNKLNAAVNAETEEGQTPLHAVAEKGYIEVALVPC